MTAEVIALHPGTVGEAFKVDPDAVLEAAKGKLPVVVVVGIDNDGALFLAGSDGPEASHFLLHRAAAMLIASDVTR